VSKEELQKAVLPLTPSVTAETSVNVTTPMQKNIFSILGNPNVDGNPNAQPLIHLSKEKHSVSKEELQNTVLPLTPSVTTETPVNVITPMQNNIFSTLGNPSVGGKPNTQPLIKNKHILAENVKRSIFMRCLMLHTKSNLLSKYCSMQRPKNFLKIRLTI
jgi:hypothetical protein